MTDTLYHYIYIIKEYNDLPLNSAASGEVYMEMYVQYDRIIFSREWLTYDWIMPMHPYMKDYTPFYDAITYINIIKNPIPPPIPAQSDTSIVGDLIEGTGTVFELIYPGLVTAGFILLFLWLAEL